MSELKGNLKAFQYNSFNFAYENIEVLKYEVKAHHFIFMKSLYQIKEEAKRQRSSKR